MYEAEIDRISDLLRKQIGMQRPPKCWETFVATLPPEDDVPASSDEGGVDIIGGQFIIRYVDAKEQESQRRIRIMKLETSSHGDLLLKAYCFERRRMRSFLAKRVLEAINAETGEVFDAPYAFFEKLAPHAPTAETLEKAAPGVQILTTLAICDGHLDQEEVQVILNFIDYHATTLDTDWSCVEAYVRSIWPDVDAFDVAVRRAKLQGAKEMSRIVRAAKKLVVADGVLSGEEVELMQALNDTSIEIETTH